MHFTSAIENDTSLKNPCPGNNAMYRAVANPIELIERATAEPNNKSLQARLVSSALEHRGLTGWMGHQQQGTAGQAARKIPGLIAGCLSDADSFQTTEERSALSDLHHSLHALVKRDSSLAFLQRSHEIDASSTARIMDDPHVVSAIPVRTGDAQRSFIRRHLDQSLSNGSIPPAWQAEWLPEIRKDFMDASLVQDRHRDRHIAASVNMLYAHPNHMNTDPTPRISDRLAMESTQGFVEAMGLTQNPRLAHRQEVAEIVRFWGSLPDDSVTNQAYINEQRDMMSEHFLYGAAASEHTAYRSLAAVGTLLTTPDAQLPQRAQQLLVETPDSEMHTKSLEQAITVMATPFAEENVTLREKREASFHACAEAADQDLSPQFWQGLVERSTMLHAPIIESSWRAMKRAESF